MMVRKNVKIVYKDGRGRISLGRYVDHDMFMVDIAEDGVVTLTPMVAVARPQVTDVEPEEATEEVVHVNRLVRRYEEIMK